MRWLALAGVLAVLSLATPCLGQIESDPTDLDLDGIPGVLPAPANPQPPVPSVLTGTGRLLIDRSHRGNFNVSGFTNFLASQGWVIADHPLGGGPISASVLSGYDILLVPDLSGSTSIDPYSASEIAAVQAFLGEENGLWIIDDAGDNAGINTLALAFGVTFHIDQIEDPTNNEGHWFWPTIYQLEPHPVSAGVESYGYYLGACLGVTPPAISICRADEDAYSYNCPVGSRPPTLAVWESTGRAVFSGDITPLSPPWWASIRPEERLLLQNIANWLLGDSPTSASTTTWGNVKSIYAAPANQREEVRP